MTDCLIIGPRTAWNIKEVFEMFLSGVLRNGHQGHKHIEEMQFLDPYGEVAKIPVCFFTTLQVKDFDTPFVLTKTYRKEDYKIYDNYDAIEVSRLNDIPKDYTGNIGVPLSFLKYYPELDYEIIEKKGGLKVDGKTKFIRLIIRRKEL